MNRADIIQNGCGGKCEFSPHEPLARHYAQLTKMFSMEQLRDIFYKALDAANKQEEAGNDGPAKESWAEIEAQYIEPAIAIAQRECPDFPPELLKIAIGAAICNYVAAMGCAVELLGDQKAFDA